MKSRPPLVRATVLHLLIVMAIVLAPHVVHVPPWASVLVAVALLWRAGAAWRGWRMPGWIIRGLLAVAGMAGVYATFGRVNGQIAGVSLLVVMTALKLTELRDQRDALVLIFLMYFLLITHFLFSQELWTVVYLLGCTVLITWVLIEVSHPGRQLAARRGLRLSALMVAQALPLMLVMFVLFPRIPGPLWGLPSDSGAAVSGLSNSMSPGDIERLVESNKVAFRVRFQGAAPPREELYWRGPVFAFFNGRTWTPGLRPNGSKPPTVKLSGHAYNYRITLEANRQHWLFALDMPDPSIIPANAYFSDDATLLSRKAVKERREYRLRSYTHYLLQTHLSKALRKVFLQLPYKADPEARALAERWRQEGLDDRGVINAALKMFRSENFIYTLHPPKLGAHSIDEFLFDTRKGFCEHYASAFTFLMRAAGIPARVVTGYQGGQYNAIGNYYVVLQSDAHAWSEVWLKGQGWVRVDPTAAVSPARVELGIDAALPNAAGLPGYLNMARVGALRYALQARWDWLNAQWNQWVLAYGPDLQKSLMAKLGLVNWRDMILALTAAISVLLAMVGLSVSRGTRPLVATDAATVEWRRALRWLRRHGFEPKPGEGPHDFSMRVADQQPTLADAMSRVESAYLRQRYLGGHASEELRRAVKALLATRPKDGI